MVTFDLCSLPHTQCCCIIYSVFCSLSKQSYMKFITLHKISKQWNEGFIPFHYIPSIQIEPNFIMHAG